MDIMSMACRKYDISEFHVLHLMLLFDGMPTNSSLLITTRLSELGMIYKGQLTPKGRAVCAELTGLRVLPEPEREMA